MHSQTVRKTFIDFFRSRGHREIPSSTLIGAESDGVLFTVAGMQPLIAHLMGAPHPSGRRLVNSQRCLRTVDIDEVGDPAHLTCFEMLGVWSLGDYFKRESLRWTLELLCDAYGLDPGRLCVTVFETDAESPRIWAELGMPERRIFRYGAEHNWWALDGPGPCGPDSEVFYWTGDGPPEGEPATDPRWVELGNNVFMQYSRDEAGRLTELAQRNVDIGAGLERLVTVIGGHGSVYDTDLFRDTIERIRRLSRHRDVYSERIVADHLRSSAMLIRDGVRPANQGRGYVLRRLIRRMVRHGRLLGIDGELTGPLATEQPPEVLDVLTLEERTFSRTLRRGLRELERTVRRGGCGDGELVHRMFETHGLPPEITVEELDRLGVPAAADWRDGYERRRRDHAERSRATP
jgi:alanyl-tRNA synthetase